MKKLSNSLIAALGLAGMLLFVNYSCKKAAEDKAEQQVEIAIEESDGTEAEVDITDDKITIETEEGKTEITTGMKEWPSDIPGEVPHFKYGEFDGAMTGDTPESMTWVLNFSGIQDQDIENYESRLDKAGFKTSKLKMTGAGLTLIGTKGNLSVTVRYGDSQAIVAVNREK